MKKRIADIKIGNRYRKDLGDIESLAASMSDIGLLQPIVIDQAGNLVAGRRRIEAAKSLEWPSIDCVVVNIDAIIKGERDENAQRKAFTPSEMVAISEACIEREKILAKDRQRKHGGTAPGKTKETLVKNLRKCSNQREPTAKEKAAQAVGTTRPTLEKAVAVVKAATDEPEKYGDLVAVMDEGSPTKAIRELNKRKRQEEIRRMDNLPDSKYRVVYADPPWHYDNNGMMDNYGHAERHYATMTFMELCDLPIKSLIEKDAVLFIWVTSPILPDVFTIIQSWGFTYKASFVWDKIKHNFGNYNSVRHEFLLIATRGSCVPEIDDKIDSVQTIEKTGKHSEKPEHFRVIIDRLYPHGKRVELFARTATEGWDTWGTENLNNCHS